MSNPRPDRRRRTATQYHFKCEDCLARFALHAKKGLQNPYPVDPDMPAVENAVLCPRCRREQDELFDTLVRTAE